MRGTPGRVSPSSKPVRRLNLGDLALLVVAAALGLSMRQWAVGLKFVDLTEPKIVPIARRAMAEVGIYLVPLALALLVARLRGPQPRRTRLVRQPGTVACLAIALHPLVYLALYLARIPAWLVRGEPIEVGFAYYNFFLGAISAGEFVVIAWIVQAFVRAWRPEPDAIDRAGRALGVLAILLWFVGSVF